MWDTPSWALLSALSLSIYIYIYIYIYINQKERLFSIVAITRIVVDDDDDDVASHPN